MEVIVAGKEIAVNKYVVRLTRRNATGSTS